MTGIEFDIGDRVYAFPDSWSGYPDHLFFIGTVTEVFETFGNRGRRFRVWLDTQHPTYTRVFPLTPEQRRLSYVFGDWQLTHIGGGL
jgi:hypothetical protein